jgi:hypothetical protein
LLREYSGLSKRSRAQVLIVLASIVNIDVVLRTALGFSLIVATGVIGFVEGLRVNLVEVTDNLANLTLIERVVCRLVCRIAVVLVSLVVDLVVARLVVRISISNTRS